ncbi:MAG TPA: tetratricopeptide repeat protein [Casimicrobiaceae bacterium]|nr:tetratricopeptide repeat protein [Casimicrobiaceae bacterium]
MDRTSMTDPGIAIRDALARGDSTAALQIAQAHAALEPRDVDAARRYATLCSQLENGDVERAWRTVLVLTEGDPEAHYMLGNVEGDRSNFKAAADHFRAALLRAPTHPQLRASLGLALDELGELAEAEACFRQALGSVADAPYPLIAALARNLFRQRRFVDALRYFDMLSRRFGIADASLDLAYAVCLSSTGREDEADAMFRRAIELDATAPGIARDYAAFLMRRERYADAMQILEPAHDRFGSDLLASSMLLVCRLQLADWRDVGTLRATVTDGAARGLTASDDIIPAYDFLAICDDPLLQRTVAQRWANTEAPGVAPSPPMRRSNGGRLRLGFVSSDYNNHPVGRLIVGLFERLDRRRFKIVAYATAPRSSDRFGARIENAVDHYRMLDPRDPAVSARTLANDAIDVLFDLNGFSGGEAVRIFGERPAPVQINFLGYTGTLGSSAYDFIVTDRYCVRPEQRAAFTERLLYIDPCYLPSDPQRQLATVICSRSDYALTPSMFVFAAFAAVYKIVPEMFDCWMTLLRDVPDSVLWLRHLPTDRLERLRTEAARRGVDRARLFSAPGENIDRYLARFALADLFLDSAPFGSHTTVNDALYAGLPVVTFVGESFASRASASQLQAVGLPELIADNLDQYGEIARTLATNPTRLTEIKRSLADTRSRSSLFDMEAYTRAFETAVVQAYESHASDK